MAKAKGGKDRPKSSANKRKKAGSPDGSDTPMDGPLTSLDNYPAPPIVDVIRGHDIEQLMVMESDMIAMRPTRSTTPPRELKPIEVRKKKVVSNVPTKQVAVLKQIQSDLRGVAAQSAGPRYNEHGEILPYSLLGDVSDYRRSMIASGNEEVSRAPKPIIIEPSSPEVIQETKETQALKNWQRQLQAHSKQKTFLSRRTGKDQSTLLMNRVEEYRSKQEQRTIIDRAIPVMDSGKGYRVGSEFWCQPQQIGGENSAVVMTLNQSEQGKHPDLEHIGNPFSDESKQGHMYPWKRNKFFETRKQELSSVINEQASFKPDFTNLYVKGRKELVRPVDDEDVEIKEPEVRAVPETENTPETERKGPILEINGTEASWGSKQGPSNIRMLFTSDAGTISTQHLQLKNTGTTAIFYAWKFVPKENNLNTIMEGNIQRFYFCINDGVILPNQEVSIPLIFLSKQAGIYSECWQFITKPTLNDGAAIVISLKGVALKRDIYKAEKEKIEEILEKRQTQYNIKLLVEELIHGVHSPPPAPSPPPPGPTLPEKFNNNNPYLHYQSDYFEQAAEMWKSINEDTPWDETLDSLRHEILKLSIEEQTEKMGEFNKLREQFTSQRQKPFSQESYDLCYGCLKSAVDSLETEDVVLRSTLSLPERVHIEEIPAPEPDTLSEKTETKVVDERVHKDSSALVSPAPDSKKGKKDGDRKKDVKTASKEKPRSTSKAGKKSDANLAPDEDETATEKKKEWTAIEDPVLKKKYQEKLYILTYNLLSSSVDHIALVLEEETGKPF